MKLTKDTDGLVEEQTRVGDRRGKKEVWTEEEMRKLEEHREEGG
jgi:hypothetical protein